MSGYEVPAGAPFGTAELPYGVFTPADGITRVGVAIGGHVLDLVATWQAGGLDPAPFAHASLNPFLTKGPAFWRGVREHLIGLLVQPGWHDQLAEHLQPLAEVELHLPFAVADYVDFYASIDHASNLGRMFRPDGEPLTPNWRHMPIGYHGRAGTVVVSGTPITRPQGQLKAPDSAAPTFGPSRKLDIEAELGWVVGAGSDPGIPVSTENFHDHVFGVVILNDWSARDLQAWEYVPLGPLLGKSFGTSISAWVLPIEALEHARIPLPANDPPLLPYLSGQTDGYDIVVEVEINGQVVSRCPYAQMSYSPAQMLAHMTINGAHLRTGDLYGSGTISGPEVDQRGSLIELSWNGTQPLDLGNGTTRTFLEDGDEVVLRASTARGPLLRLGEVRGTIRGR